MKKEFDITINLYYTYNKIKDGIKKLSKKEYKSLLKKIDIQKAIKDKNKTLVLNYIFINYAKDSDKALSQLKRDKVFTLSIDSKNEFIIKVLDFLLKKCQIEDINKDITYFQSKRNLAFFSDDIYYLSQKIRKQIKNSKSTFVRDLLYIVDMKFYKNNISEAENLSEVSSSLIFLYSKIHHNHIISERTFSLNNVFNNKKIDNLLYNAFKVKNFQDMEKFIDNFDYLCIKNKNNFFVKSQNTLLEKSRRYGDFHSDMQRKALYLDTSEKYNNSLSFNDFIKKLSKSSKYLFEFVEYPIKRYIFKFPIGEEIKKFILEDKYFLEEIFHIKEIKKEYALSDDKLMNFKVSKTSTITIKDLIIIKRIYTIIAVLNSSFLTSILEKDKTKEQIVFNSWIKAFKYQNLKKTLTPFIGESKAKEFISEFSWQLEESKKLDLQYTPLVKLDDYYFPMNIFINSNLFRNSLFKNKKRPHDIDGNDIISKEMYEVLRKNFKCVEMEVNFDMNTYKGDFDVIAYIDNTIYVFECKNTITPADLHELRTTYIENLQKGFTQLTKCKNVLKSEGFIKDLNHRLNWTISSNVKIVTTLVLGTRMFNGYTDGTHHVRSSHELFNFLDNGKIGIQDNGENKQISLWENEKISANDIYNFIENRALYKLIFNSFNIQKNKVSFEKYNLFFETFEFQLEDFYEKLKSEFGENIYV